MAYKVNYNFQKAERDRAKAAKKEAKLREKQSGRTGSDAEGQEPAEAGTETAEQPAAQD